MIVELWSCAERSLPISPRVTGGAASHPDTATQLPSTSRFYNNDHDDDDDVFGDGDDDNDDHDDDGIDYCNSHPPPCLTRFYNNDHDDHDDDDDDDGTGPCAS